MDPAQQYDWIVQLDPKSILDTYRNALGVTITSFRSLILAVHSGEFAEDAQNDKSPNFLKFQFVGFGAEHSQVIEQQFISDVFRSMVSTTFQLMDKLIAIKRLFDNFVVGADIVEFDSDIAYVEYRIRLATEEVGRDHSLRAPHKVTLFDRLPSFSSKALLEYAELRNILEHRHGTADRDRVLMWTDLVLTRNGKPIEDEHRHFEAGDALGMRFVECARSISANTACNLTLDEIHHVQRSLHWTIGPDLVAHLFPPDAVT